MHCSDPRSPIVSHTVHSGDPKRPMLRRSILVSVSALVVVVASSGQTAFAAITGLQVASAGSEFTSSNKSVTIACPSGKRVLGAGANITLGALPVGDVVLEDITPNGTLTSVTARGLEDQNGTAEHWAASARAVCAPPPPGLQRVLATSPTDSANKSATATCPTGKRLLGTGGEIAGAAGAAALAIIRPNPGLTGVVVRGLEDGDGTTAKWSVKAYAICANPVAGLQRVTAASPAGSENNVASANCSAGKQVTGVGGEISASAAGQVVMNQIIPGPTYAWVNGAEDDNGTASTWSVSAYAICAAVSQRVAATTTIDSSDPKSVSAQCPAGMRVTGVGGDVTGAVGEAQLDALIPRGTSVGAGAFEDDTGLASNWSLHAYAVCATPLPGLEIVSDTSNSASTATNRANATCPTGKQVVGGGADLNGTGHGGNVVLDGPSPDHALTSVTGFGIEDEDGTAANWTVTAFAVCATPPPGLEVVTAHSEVDSDPASVTATCPSGKNLLGTGAFIGNAFGQAVLDDVRPNAALTSVTVTAHEDRDGYAGDWFVVGHAICANP